MDMRGIQKRIGTVGISLHNLFRSALAHPYLLKAVVCVLKFGVGYILSKGVILGGYAPFGLAYAASLGVGGGSLFGIVGAIFGYLSILQIANGLKYVAICILIYTAGFVFRSTNLMKKTWFMPVSALVSSAAVGFVFVADSGFALSDTVFFITELVLVFACTYFYQYYFNPLLAVRRKSHPTKSALGMVSLLVLLSSLLIPLSSITFLGAISLGRAIAVLCVMLAGYHGGIGVGSCAGVAFGLSIGIASGTPAYCAIYGFSAIAAGAFHKKGRLLYTVVYLISNAAAMLWITGGTDIPCLYEAFAASVFFLLFVEFFAGRVPVLSAVQEESGLNQNQRVRLLTQERLHKASSAFADLGDMLSSVFSRAPRPNDNNISCVFDRPAQEICRKCQLSGACWEKDYITTKDALNKASAAMQKNGRLDAGDLPLHFSSRCVKLDDFIGAVNRELVAYQYRRQYRSRIHESRVMICKQYREMAHVFDDLANEVANEPVFCPREELRLRRLLNQDQIPAEVCVYRDGANHLHVRIQGADLTELMEHADQYREEFSQALAVTLTDPETETGAFGHRVTLRQAEPLCASLGVAVHKKKDSDISGDSGSYFKLDDGRLCVILSDGMGTGKEAAADSASAIRMLEQFLKSGIDPCTSLATINSALILKSEALGGFATLDLMCADLFDGETNFFKFGSAPTYIKRGKHIRRITSSALPAGIAPSGTANEIDKTRIKLHSGDFVVLASDGVADASDDVWLQALLSEYDGTTAKELASSIMTNAFSKYGRSDDMTVMVVSINKNK